MFSSSLLLEYDRQTGISQKIELLKLINFVKI